MAKVWNKSKKDIDDDNDNNVNSGISDSDGDEKKIRTMVHLSDFNVTMSIWGIESIEKKNRFIETPNPRWQYGIVINGDIERSMRFPKTDISAWFENESYRDCKYERLLSILEIYGFRVIDI